MKKTIRDLLARGAVIPAHPLALNAQRKLDERRQRALTRYYIAAGAGGLAVGVHTTQFAIRHPKHSLYEPVLALAAEEMDRADGAREKPLIRVAGVCGDTPAATAEAKTARGLGYHAALLSLAALRCETEDALIRHVRAVAKVLPVFGFYLQPAVGGMPLPYSFWRRFALIKNVCAIKIACFNRYQTAETIRAIAETGRDDIALYTGNDDNIVADLVTPFRFPTEAGTVTRHFTGGLLGHWAVWTRAAVALHQECRAAAETGAVPAALLARAAAVTDMNAALFDVAHNFHGCIAGIHEVLRRQGLLEGIWCLDRAEGLSSGQAQELDRVIQAYPDLVDDAFVEEHRGEWLRG